MTRPIHLRLGGAYRITGFIADARVRINEGEGGGTGAERGDTFSPVMANGALNHCSNVEHDLKMVGRRKLSRAHSSGSLFYNTTRHMYGSHRALNGMLYQ